MLDASALPLDTVREVRDTCLCLAAQRAARRLARRFDRAFQGVGLTNGQFSMLLYLSGSPSRTLAELADFLAMDRTTVTALAKALRRRGLVEVSAGEKDRRRRSVAIAAAGRQAVWQALAIWRDEHRALEASLPANAASAGREFLSALCQSPLQG